MKKFVILLGMVLLMSNTLLAQKLIIGVKAPDLKIQEWITDQQPNSGKPTLIEFFFSRSEPSCRRLTVMDSFAKKYGDSLNVIVIACEPKERVLKATEKYIFAVGLDTDNKTFSAYGAEFVPFGVLLDDKNKVLWFGNSSKFGDQELQAALSKK